MSKKYFDTYFNLPEYSAECKRFMGEYPSILESLKLNNIPIMLAKVDGYNLAELAKS
jgi:hypothetical protein